jgi:FkbM family methyltransferase
MGTIWAATLTGRRTKTMLITRTLRTLLRNAGYDIIRYRPVAPPVNRLQRLLHTYQIDTVIDVGANSGGFAQYLRTDLGYTKRILSFEPLRSAYMLLKAKAANDPCWETFNIALGDTEVESEINIAGNSYSSSLLDMLPSHLTSAPESGYIGKETIEVRKLDSLFEALCDATNTVYMKIDTQGFESRVLRGAQHALQQIDTVQMEMSLVPLYEGEMLFDELHRLMKESGYSLVDIIPGFADRNSGRLLQIDGVFHRYR